MNKIKPAYLPAEEKFQLAPPDWETKMSLLILFIPTVTIFMLMIVTAALVEQEDFLESVVGALGLVFLAVIISIAFYAFAPAAYILTHQNVKITRRLAPPILIPYSSIKDVFLERFFQPPPVTLRLGSYPPHGFWGYYGRFKVDRLGWIRVYATSWGQMVVLDADCERYFFSPAEPESFYEALKNRISKKQPS